MGKDTVRLISELAKSSTGARHVPRADLLRGLREELLLSVARWTAQCVNISCFGRRRWER